MKHYLLKGGFAALLTMGSLSALAVPANPRPIDITQPDGSTVTVRAIGDERGYEYYSLDGQMMITDADGFLRPASEKETAVHRNSQAARRALGDKPNYIFNGTPFPATGEPHGLVVIVQYTDVKFSMDDPLDFYTRQLNGEDYTDYGATGSARQYFIDNSNGLFKPTFDVMGPFTLKNNQKYYGGNVMMGGYSDEPHAREMVTEACQQMYDAGHDLSIYDHDGDGVIDNVFVIYAGNGEADNPNKYANTVWPHSADFAAYQEFPTYGDVTLNRYGCTNELDSSYQRPDGIGTFVHEFSHVLGLPDLYNTINSYDASTPGNWSALDYGPYNNQGRTPPFYSAFERYSLNWIEPRTLQPGEQKLEPLPLVNDALILTVSEDESTGLPKEFYMFENRQLISYDAHLPNHGMLIWHIDFDQEAWDDNSPNNQMRHQRVKLVCADNQATSSSYAGDSWPGSRKKTAIGYSTSPNLRAWDGENLKTEITEIAEDGETVTFLATIDGKTETGIAGIEEEATVWCEAGLLFTRSAEALPVYDTLGQRRGSVSAGEPLELPAGLYIAGRTKVLVK